MNNVTIYTLFSGSSGNCTYVKCDDTAFLIDAGASRKAIRTALASLGTDISDIQAIFVTHEHSDHIKGIPMIAKYDRIPIYVCPVSCGAFAAVEQSLIKPLRHPQTVTLGEVKVTSFVTQHDALSSCGYVVEYRNHRFGYATDIGQPTRNVTDALRGCHAVILEANYDKEMLKYSPYPFLLKQRIEGNYGHMDNDTCAAFCSFLSRTGTKRVLLAHLSEENNTPEIARSTVMKRLQEDAVTLDVAVAKRYEPTELITLPLC